MSFDLAMNEPGNLIPIILEDAQYPSLEAALADNPGFHLASTHEYGIYERYWNTFHEGKWTPSSGADANHRDQEIDLGNGWWAVVGDEGTTWSWEVNDHWLRDEGPSVAEGVVDTEEAAKRAALVAYATAERVPEPVTELDADQYLRPLLDSDEAVCQRCNQELIEIPADDADWQCSTLWVTHDGAWGCGSDDPDGRAALHVPRLT